MSHGFEIETAQAPALVIENPIAAALDRVLNVINRIILVAAQIALIAASLVLTYSVAARYFFKIPTYWQDEAAVFLLVGAVFLSSAYVQSKRGHIGIEALTGLLSPGQNRIRLLLVDIASFSFCAFFAWKSWTLTHEAWVDGQVSSSTWAPPLSIPYSIMASGMTLLSIQFVLQILLALSSSKPAKMVETIPAKDMNNKEIRA